MADMPSSPTSSRAEAPVQPGAVHAGAIIRCGYGSHLPKTRAATLAAVGPERGRP